MTRIELQHRPTTERATNNVVAWTFPTRILFGPGSAAEVGKEAQRILGRSGRHVLVVTDEGIKQTGALDVVVRSLGAADFDHTVFSGVVSNPTRENVERAAEAFHAAKADLIVAVGGGSVLDTGKLVRIRAVHAGELEAFSRSKTALPPMIAIPTTAGTGSEVARSAVVSVGQGAQRRKTVVSLPELMPTVAILDPELTRSLPPRTTAATGFEALAHCIEAYCATGDHPMADAIALDGIELIARNLERAVHHGEDLDARGAMLKAAMMSAVAVQKGVGASSALAQPIASAFNLHHGLASALCLPAVLDYNRSAIPSKIARIARILGVRATDVETLAFECAGAVRALRHKAGLPDGLAAVGVTDDDVERLAAIAFQDPAHHTNPRECTEEDMLSLYRASL